MSVTTELSKALDSLTPLKRKILSDDSNGKRLKKSSKGSALDLESFYSRLSTYRPGNWNSFHPLSPLLAASWGWVCNEEDQNLHCVSCRGRLLTTLPKKSIPSVFHKTANILRNRINTSIEKGGAHEKFCPWLVANCPDIFQEVFLASKLSQPSGALKDTFYREWILPFNQLLTLNHIPYIPRAFRPKYSLTLIRQILKESFSSSLNLPQDKSHLESLLALAVCGWQKQSDFIVRCNICQRSCGLWTLPSPTDKVSLEREEKDNALEEKMLEESKKEETLQVEEPPAQELLQEVESSKQVREEESTNSVEDEVSTDHPSTEEESIDDDEEERQSYPSPEYSDEESTSVKEAEEERSSDSDVIEIISSSDDEVLRDDDDENEDAPESDNNSIHSTEEIEIEDNDSKDVRSPPPSKSNSFTEDEDVVNKSSSTNESIKDSSNDKIPTDDSKDESRVMCEKIETEKEDKPEIQADKKDNDADNQGTKPVIENRAPLPSQNNLNETDEAENVDSNVKTDGEDKKNVFFNPISQHQPWCPWIVKGPSTGRTGFETILFILEKRIPENVKTASRFPSPNVHDKMKKMLSVLENIVN